MPGWARIAFCAGLFSAPRGAGHTAPKRRFSGKERCFFGYGYDFGQPHAAAAPVFSAHAGGQYLPAVLQHGGRHDRWPLCGRGRAGRRGRHGRYVVPGAGLCHRACQRVLRGGVTALRRAGRGRAAPVRGHDDAAVPHRHRRGYGGQFSWYRTDAARHEHAGKHLQRQRRIHRHHLSGAGREPVLQSVLRPAARRGRQQNAVVFPVPLQRAERRAGPSVRCDVLHGRGGRRLGHHPFSGRFGAAVPGLYAEKIPHPAHRPARWCAALPGWAFPRRCPTA